MLNMPSVSDMVEYYRDTAVGLYDKFAPMATSYLKDKPLPWLTDNIKLMMSLRNDALSRYRATKTDAHKSYYKLLKKQVETAMFFEKQAYYRYHINNIYKDSKTLWKHLKENILTENNKYQYLPSQFDSPDLINDHFLSLPGDGAVSPMELSYFKSNRYNEAVFALRCVDEVEVGKAILSIQSNAYGIDGMSKDMILLTLPHTLPYITALLNKSISTSTFPQSWKTAVVTPIPKVSSPAAYSVSPLVYYQFCRRS